MRYSKGDKVIIKSIDWYNQMLFIPDKLVWLNKLTNEFIGIWCGSYVFTREMCSFCDSVMTIKEVNEDYYIMEEDIYNNKFTDEMIDDIVMPVVMPKFKKNDKVETNDGLLGYIYEIKYDEVKKCYKYYVSFIVDGRYYYEEQLKFHVKKESDSIVPKFKVGDEIVKKDGISNSYLVSSVGSEYYGLSLPYPNNGVGVLPVKDQDEWELLSSSDMENNEFMKSEIVEKPSSLIDFMDMLNNEISLPEGYEFRDGDGNLIAVDKIVLAKKRPKYPQSYEECCEIVKVGKEHTLEGEIIRINNYKISILESFQKLLICRDAYWEIAGEEMKLGDMWEPDWSDDCRKFSIVVEGNEILADVCLRRNRILVFPTEEMRDMFLKVFRKDIEECKEFL